MHHRLGIVRMNLIVVAAIALFSNRLLANSVALTSASGPWLTTSHVGFSVNDQSSTGFKMTGGTMAMLDLSRPIGKNLELGLRTIASGAQAKTQEFYRLGAGPLIVWRWNDRWTAHGTITNFNETGLKPGSDPSYKSKGFQYLVGWERVWQLSNRVEALAGNFITYHAGSMSTEGTFSGITADQHKVVSSSARNFGVSHGAELAIRLSM